MARKRPSPRPSNAIDPDHPLRPVGHRNSFVPPERRPQEDAEKQDETEHNTEHDLFLCVHAVSPGVKVGPDIVPPPKYSLLHRDSRRKRFDPPLRTRPPGITETSGLGRSEARKNGGKRPRTTARRDSLSSHVVIGAAILPSSRATQTSIVANRAKPPEVQELPQDLPAVERRGRAFRRRAGGDLKVHVQQPPAAGDG